MNECGGKVEDTRSIQVSQVSVVQIKSSWEVKIIMRTVLVGPGWTLDGGSLTTNLP